MNCSNGNGPGFHPGRWSGRIEGAEERSIVGVDGPHARLATDICVSVAQCGAPVQELRVTIDEDKVVLLANVVTVA